MVYRVMPPYIFEWGPSGGVFGEAHAVTTKYRNWRSEYRSGMLSIDMFL